MKFGCDSCGAQYMIADEKVGKSGVKVRCKKCSHLIVVRPQANDEIDQATIVMDNPLADLQRAEAPAFSDDSADVEIGAAFDSIFGEKEGGSDSLEGNEQEPEDPFSTAVDHAFNAALEEGGEFDQDDDDASDTDSTRVFSSQEMRKVEEELQYASSPLFDDSEKKDPEVDREEDEVGEDEEEEEHEDEHEDELGFGATSRFDARERQDDEPRLRSDSLFDDGLQLDDRQDSDDFGETDDSDADEDQESGKEWHVALGDKQIGPLSVEDVQARWESGDLSPDTLVWRHGFPDWRPLSNVDELKHLIAPTPDLGGWYSSSHTDSSGDDDLSERFRDSEDSEGEPTWKPAAASLLASLAAEEISALESEAEEGNELAGPNLDPVAEVAPEQASSFGGLGDDLPTPPMAEDDDSLPESPHGDDLFKKSGLGFPNDEDLSSKPSFDSGHSSTSQPFAHRSHLEAGHDDAAGGGLGYFQGSASYPDDDGTSEQRVPPQKLPLAGYGAGPVTASPPPPPGISRKLLFGVAGGGAALSVPLVLAVLFFTGAIGSSEKAPEGFDPTPIRTLDPVSEVPEPAEINESDDGSADLDDSVEQTEAQEEAEELKKAESSPPAAEEATVKQTATVRKAETPAPQKSRAAPTKTPPLPRKRASPPPPPPPDPAPRQPEPVSQEPPPSPPRARSVRDADPRSLEEELFGTPTRRPAPSSSTGSKQDSAKEASPSPRKGYIPPAAGSRERDLPREVSRGDIMRVVGGKRGDLRTCVNRHRDANPGDTGRVVMGWRIQPDGTPTGIQVKTSQYRGSVIAQCLTQVISTMRFPRYGGPPMSEIEFPFDF